MKLNRAMIAWAVAIVPSIALILASQPADAIPAWTRKYDIDCATCHFGGTNRLTQFGKDFLLRGHRTKDDEGITDPSTARLMDYMSFASKFRYENDSDTMPRSRFDVEALSIYSGGPAYGNFSYFFEFYLHERGKETSSGGGQIDTATRSKLAEAYLFYNSNPQGGQWWFARAGSITPRIIHTASTGGRVSVSRPRILNDNVGGGNLFTPRDRFYGVTVGGVTQDRFIFEAGITNGGGGNARPNQSENNEFKDIFGSVEKEFDDYGSSLGFFAYSGAYPITGPPAFEDRFARYGFVGSFVRDQFEVSGGYFFGTNRLSGGGNRNPNGYFVESAYNFSQDLTGFVRYDLFDPDLAAKKTGITGGVSYRLDKLGRVIIEYGQTKTAGASTNKKFTLELNWMF